MGEASQAAANRHRANLCSEAKMFEVAFARVAQMSF